MEDTPLFSCLKHFEGLEEASERKILELSNLLSSLLHKADNCAEESHSEAIDAHRELAKFVRETKSIVGCEALLRLVTSSQREQLSNEVSDSLDWCVESFKANLKESADRTATLCAIPGCFVKANNDLSLSAKLDLCTACISLFGKVGDDLGLDSLRDACWSALLLLFPTLSPQQRGAVLLEVLSVGALRYDDLKKSSSMVNYYCQRVELKDSKDIGVDALTVLVLSLIQSTNTDFEAVCFEFSTRFVDLCMRSFGEDKDRSKACFAFIRQFTIDCLALLRAPEWPCAETFLVQLVERIESTLRESLKTSKTSTSFAALCIELVSKILAQIELDSSKKDKFFVPPCLATSGESPLRKQMNIRIEHRMKTPNDEGEVIGCLCGLGVVDQNKFMLDCDRCHRWFHGSCVGVSEIYLKDLVYLCDDCQVYSQLEEVEANYTSPPNKKQRKAQVNHQDDEQAAPCLSEDEKERDRMRLVAEHLHGQQESNGSLIFDQAKTWYESVRKANFVLDANDNEEVATHNHSSASKHYLSRYGASRLCRLLAHTPSRWRSSLVGVREKMLISLLATMRGGNAPTIRSTAVKGFSCVLDAQPSLIQDIRVKQAVEERVRDEASSVREACLDTISTASSPEYRLISLVLMSDTSIAVRKKAVRLAFEVLIAENTNQEETSKILEELSKRLEDRGEEHTMKDLVSKELIKYFTSPNAHASFIAEALQGIPRMDWFVKVMKEANEDSRTEKSMKTKMVQVVDSLVNSQSDQCFRLLKGFCKADSHLLDKHINLLIPHLAPNPPPKDSVAVEICEILGVAQNLANLDVQRALQLQHNLERLVFTCNPSTLPSCVRALENLHRQVGFPDVDSPIDHFKKIMFQLLNFMEKANRLPGERDYYARSLYGCALLVRYHDGYDGGIVTRVGDAVASFVNSPDVSLQKRAIQALGLLIIRRPSEAWTHDVSQALKLERPFEVKLQALVALHEILLAAGEEVTDRSDSDVSLLNGFVQRQLGACLQLMKMDLDSRIRLSSAKVLQLLLHHGVVHMEQCISHLISLLRDPACHGLMQACLAEINERHKIGWHHAFKGIIESVPPNQDHSSDDPNCFSDLYVELVSKDRKTRISFLNQLCQACLKQEDLSNGMFLHKVVAACPVTSNEELLSMIHSLRKGAWLNATNILPKLDPLFVPFLKQHRKKSKKRKENHDDPEANGVASDQEEGPEQGDEANDILSDDVVADCKLCCSIAMSLSLSAHLMKVYSISAKQVEQFLPNQISFSAKDEKPLSYNYRNLDKQPPVFIPPFKQSFQEMFASHQRNKLAKYAYLTFRKALKNDDDIFLDSSNHRAKQTEANGLALDNFTPTSGRGDTPKSSAKRSALRGNSTTRKKKRLEFDEDQDEEKEGDSGQVVVPRPRSSRKSKPSSFAVLQEVAQEDMDD